MSPFDWLLLRRSTASAALALALVSLVVVATDEATSTTGMRIARLAAFEPLSAAAAIALVLRQSRDRGELRAFSCLGVPEWRAARGAVIAGLAFGALGMLLLLSPWADARSLFPSVHGAVDWVMDSGGRFAHAPAVFTTDSGVLTLSVVGDAAIRPLPTALAALPSVTPLALVVPSWTATPMPSLARAATLAVSATTVVVVLHLVAAGRIPAALGALSALPVVLATLAFRVRR